MMKKLKIAIILIGCIIFATSCGAIGGGNQADDYPRPGSWVGDMFVNEWLGVQFQLPAGWDAPGPRQLEEILGMGAIVLEHADMEISEEVLEAMEGGAAHDMYAINFVTGSTAQIMFERLPRSARNVDIASEIDDMIEELKRELPISEATVRSNTVFIGEVEFHVMDAVLDMMGMTLYMSQYVNLEGRNLRMITIGSTDRDEIEHIWGYFNVVGADPIESVAPEFDIPDIDLTLAEEDFIGIWDWDMGMDYEYEFFEDGTGIRGMPGVLEEFTWTLVDGELHLRLGGMMELWVPTIEGDVLTITSLQIEGMTYSYIRR